MTGTTVLDAHALLWFLEGSEQLSPEAQRRFSNPAARLVLPAIALAEICWAIHKGRSHLRVDDVRAALASDQRLQVVPIDGDIVFAAASLPANLEMHDRLIAATTARELATDPSTVLLTFDQDLRQSRVVPTVW
jgi:PIN domain nuclease of toxin-antitoxin system